MRSFAGNIAIDRPGHPNDTLFFWAYEKTNGSLTNIDNDEPWGIWLNGGPGASSIIGALFEVKDHFVEQYGAQHFFFEYRMVLSRSRMITRWQETLGVGLSLLILFSLTSLCE